MRKEVEALLNFEGNFEDALATFQKLPWEFEGEEIQVTEEHILRAVELFLSNNISAEQLEKWADAFDVREYAACNNNDTHEALFMISYPEGNFPEKKITKENMHALKEKLQNKG